MSATTTLPPVAPASRPASLDLVVFLSCLAVGFVQDSQYPYNFYFVLGVLPLIYFSREQSRVVSSREENLGVLAILAICALDYLVLGAGVFQLLSHFLMLGTVLLLYMEQNRERMWRVLANCLFILAIAGGSTLELSFGLLFLPWLAFGVIALQAIQRLPRGGKWSAVPAEPPASTWRWWRLPSLALITCTALGTVVLFFTIPRSQANFLQRTFQADEQTTVGFNEEFDFSHAQTLSNSVNTESVLEIRTDMPGFLRSAVFTDFDGKRWVNRFPRLVPLPIQRGRRAVPSAEADLNANYLTHEVRVLKAGFDVLFAPSRAVGVETDLLFVSEEMTGGVLRSKSRLPAETRYTVYHSIEPNEWQLSRYEGGGADPEEVQLLFLSVPEELRGFLREYSAPILSGAGSRYQKVLALRRHLLSEFRYTTEFAGNDDMTVRRFLSEDRAGYCQHFATAMTLLLRANGIPARPVLGFTTGIPNWLSGSFLVQQRHFHAWVEVYYPGLGWVTENPTPVVATETPTLARLWEIQGDRVQRAWQRYVIDYGQGFEFPVVESVRMLLQHVERRVLLAGVFLRENPVWLLLPIALLGGLIGLFIARSTGEVRLPRLHLAWPGLGGWWGRRRVSALEREMARVLSLLASHGLALSGGTTVQEALALAEQRGLIAAGSSGELLDRYQAARYSGQALSPAEGQRIIRQIRECEKSLTQRAQRSGEPQRK